MVSLGVMMLVLCSDYMYILASISPMTLSYVVRVPEVTYDLMDGNLLTVVGICMFGNRYIIAFSKNDAYLMAFPFGFNGNSRTFPYISPHTENQPSVSVNTAFKLWRYILGEIIDWCGG